MPEEPQPQKRWRIDYFREGERVGCTPWADSLEETIKVAQGGLIRHRCDFARIIDVDGRGVEVWSGRN
jgi:hypothetical protein